MITRGTINEKEYHVIGVRKRSDGSGYTLKFIIADPNNKDGRVVGKVFIPERMAKTTGKLLLDEIN